MINNYLLVSRKFFVQIRFHCPIRTCLAATQRKIIPDINMHNAATRLHFYFFLFIPCLRLVFGQLLKHARTLECVGAHAVCLNKQYTYLYSY